MRGRSALFIAGLAVAGIAASTPATAAPLDKGHFHDVFTNFFTCESTGTPVREDGDVSGNFLFNQRGSSPFPYYRESAHGTIAWTNLETGGTFSQVFSGTSKDQTIVDNGDGTITITIFAAGGARYFDQNGKLVLKDPGEIRFAVEIDYAGTLHAAVQRPTGRAAGGLPGGLAARPGLRAAPPGAPAAQVPQQHPPLRARPVRAPDRGRPGRLRLVRAPTGCS